MRRTGWIRWTAAQCAIGMTLVAVPAAGADAASPDATGRTTAGRATIGVFRDWAAFRDGAADAPARCFAIAEPPRGTASAGRGAFASVANWPARRVRAQLAIRLSHAPRAAVTMSIGDASFLLVVRGQQAWAQDRHADATIVATMRSGSSMSISGVTATGVPFADVYRLHGAASAIDAAALGCLRDAAQR